MPYEKLQDQLAHAEIKAIVVKQERVEMLRMILAGVASLALASAASAAPKAAPAKPAAAKTVQCKDTKGKFIKCPAPVSAAVAKSPEAVVVNKIATSKSASAAGAKRCRDAKGRFAKCGSLGAK